MRVGEKWRTNPLSKKPGGHTVTLIREMGEPISYDKIKSPGPYISRITDRRGILEIQVDGETFWKRTIR
jgi:hypothetical protein